MKGSNIPCLFGNWVKKNLSLSPLNCSSTEGDSPSSEWTLWLCSEARCTAPLCVTETETTLRFQLFRRGNRFHVLTVLPVASQESHQWLRDHVDFMLWGQMPVELSDGQNHLGKSATKDQTKVSFLHMHQYIGADIRPSKQYFSGGFK